MSKRQPIAIYGGSFDPVQKEHVRIALAARDQLSVEKVFVIPTFQSPDKNSAGGTFEQRIAWLKAAFAGEQCIEILDIEGGLGAPYYTIRLMKKLHELYPNTELLFVMGADSIRNFHGWHRAEELLKLMKIVGVKRPHYNVEPDLARIVHKWLRGTPMDVSSTRIREQLSGTIYSDDVPSAVNSMLMQDNPYKGKY